MKQRGQTKRFSRPIRADLHLHSTMSDGKYSPEELVERAHRRGIELLSLTDHDTVSGVTAARKKARELGCYFVDGVELETTVQDETGTRRVVHILGYGIDPDFQPLLDLLEEIHDERVIRARQILGNLRSMGLNVPFQQLRQKTEGQSLSRVHIAQAMKTLQLVDSIDEAFNVYLGNDCPAYVPFKTTEPEQLIDLIHRAGGLAVWAHPYYSMRDELIEPLVEAGLDGVECFHADFDEDVARHYRDMAAEYDLIVTGGSDYHGTMEENFQLGEWWLDVGDLYLPLSVDPDDLDHQRNGAPG